MHKKALSFKIIEKHQEMLQDTTLFKVKFPLISTTKTENVTRTIRTSPIAFRQKSNHSASPMKKINFLVDKCEKELKKIRKISLKLKRSARKIKKNENVINKIIYRPLYSLKTLRIDKLNFLKHQSER